VTHPERGTALLERLAEELSDLGVVEQSPSQDGRNMTMMLAPSKAVLSAERPDAADGNKPAERVKHAHQRGENSHDGADGTAAELVQEPSAASADAA
jgi:translation initiation factor IF-3